MVTEEPGEREPGFRPESCRLPPLQTFRPPPPSSLGPLTPTRPPTQMPPRPGQGLPFEFCPGGLQPRPLPRRVGRPGDARRGSEPRHFPFPSTCPTSAPGLGLHPRAASVPVPEPRTEVARVREVGGRERGGASGGASVPPAGKTLPPPYTEAKRRKREPHIKLERKRLLSNPERRCSPPLLPGARGWPGKVAPFFPRGQCGVCGCPARFRLPRGWQGEPRELQARPPFLLLFPLLPHVSSRSPAA